MGSTGKGAARQATGLMEENDREEGDERRRQDLEDSVAADDIILMIN